MNQPAPQQQTSLPLHRLEPSGDLTQSSDQNAKAESRRYGVRDAAFQAAAQGGGENYFSAFALFLHASPFHIGILSALPQLVGVVAQLLSVKLLRYLRMPAQLLIGGGWAQALCWLPILSLPLLLPEHGPWLLIGCAMLSSPWWARRKALGTVYLITDQRAILLEGGWRGGVTVRYFRPDQLDTLERLQRPDGTGDIILERHRWRDSDGDRRTTQTGFLARSEVKAVEDLRGFRIAQSLQNP